MGDTNEVANEAGLGAVGAVRSIVGIVKAIDPSSVERVLQAGEKVYPNETIATSEDGLVLVDFINGTHMDLPPASQIVLDGEILELATAQSEPLTVEQIQEMVARGEDPAAIGSDNNWLSAPALRGNVLGSGMGADSIVTFANMMAVTAAGIDIAGLHGILHLEPSGDYVYTPNASNADSRTAESFSYSVQHGDGSTSVSTLNLDVNPEINIIHANLIQGDIGADILTDDGGVLLLAEPGDTIVSTDSQERLVSATDSLSYNQSADALESGRDEDILDGTKGDDVLMGGEGNDIIAGGDGNDVLIGGAGDDILSGGEGRDTFVWKTGETGSDVIRDFTQGERGDVLHLADILQDEHVNADALGSYLSFAFDGQNTRLIIDVDGSGPGTSTQTVILEGVDLTANNTLTSAMIITNLLADGNLKTDA